MPSVRSIILLAVLIFLLSITIGTLSMLQPPDSGGRGRDSYGTRGHGFRALFDMLGELNVPIERRLRPPTTDLPTGSTLALIAPDSDLVGVEPAYLKALLEWVEQGGRIVVAPPDVDPDSFEDDLPSGDTEFEMPGVLETLDLVGVQVDDIDPGAADDNTGDGRPNATSRRFPRDFPEAVFGRMRSPTPIERISVEPTGSLAGLRGRVQDLAVPGDRLSTLSFAGAEPSGIIRYTDDQGQQHDLIAEFPRGQGAILVIGDPRLFTNRFLAQAENSVLAAYLLAPAGQRVVFDEFYHGLSVRGNPLYLLTRPGYAAVVIAVLLVLAAWTWREAILLGPPLPDAPARRRDVGEYVDAMSRLFKRGKRTRAFLLREVRDGVLYQLCQQVGLPPEVHDKDTILAAIARREPQRARRLEEVLAEVDDDLARSQHWSQSRTLHAMQRIKACL